jgi:uncharacterized protein YtpQ (UPF0354 family)
VRRVIAVLVSCIAVTALAAGMSEQAFTDTFVQQARAALTGMEIKVVGPLQLQTKDKDGTEGTLFLTNAYTQYTASPEDLQVIIGNHIAALKISNQAIDPKSKDSIFAVIKPADYVTTVAAQGAKSGVDREISFVVENLNEDLRVLYVLDTESSMQILTKEGVKKTGVAESALRSIAVKNLGKYFSVKHVQIERLEKAGKGTIYLVSLDQNYEASILLLDDYWNKKTFDVAGDIVAFVPARNVVIVTGSEDKEGLRIASDVAQSGYAELGYSISPHGYRRSESGWTRFEP